MNLKTLQHFEQKHRPTEYESVEIEGHEEGESEEETSLGNRWLQNKTVLLRVDFNVPLNKDLEVTDDTRIRGALPTIQWLQERGAIIVLLAHLGRPKGTKNPRMSLMPVAESLTTLLEQEIRLCDVMDEPETLTRDLNAGDIVLLENLRFHPNEKNNDINFAKKIAMAGDFYVNDAFGLVHREHASVHALAKIFAEQGKAFAGLLIEKECRALDALLNMKSRGTTVAVLGGAKVSDKIVLIENLARRARNILIGGAMGYTFMKAQNTKVGSSKVESDKFSVARQLLELCEKHRVKVHLPQDHVCADSFSEDAEFTVVDSSDIPDGLMGLDIGPKTRAHFEQVISGASAVFWNGPMGVFEWQDTAEGTLSIAKALNACTEKGGYTIVGGGDSAAAVQQMGLASGISHISTGGGASLAYLEERTLPGLQFLEDNTKI